jgi:hypothetical protein
MKHFLFELVHIEETPHCFHDIVTSYPNILRFLLINEKLTILNSKKKKKKMYVSIQLESQLQIIRPIISSFCEYFYFFHHIIKDINQIAS